MKKTTRIIMIAAVAVAGLSTVGFFIAVLFQHYLVEAYGGNVQQLYFMVPMGDMISCFGALAIALAMLFVVCNERYPLKLDAICAGVLAVGLPMIADTVSYTQIRLTTRYMELEAALYYSHLLSICNITQAMRDLVTMLTLLACGMSIAMKYIHEEKGISSCKDSDCVV